MLYLWTALVGGLLLREVTALCGIARSIQFLARGARREAARPAKQVDVLIVVPVLREMAIIESTVRYFLSLTDCSVCVVVVTTERERAEAEEQDEPTTYDIVQRLAQYIDLTHIHYPGSRGTKADQINYAVWCLSERIPCNRWKRTFVACYDADSRPHPSTLTAFQRAADEHRDVRAFQQSSLFYRNAGTLGRPGNAVTRAFLLGNAVRQARFTLAYELPRIRSRLSYYRALASAPGWVCAAHPGRFRYAHTVGHGLFIRLDLIARTVMPTGSVLEDMFYGFMLNMMHEVVVPLNILDDSETPRSISSLYWQRTRWFLGPGRPLQYLRHSRSHVALRASRLEQIGITASCAFDAIVWAGVTPMTLGVFLTWIWLRGSPEAMLPALLGLGAGVVYLMTFALTLLAPHERLGVAWRPRIREVLLVFAALPLVVLFHSLPAYHCMGRRLATRGRPDEFGKTER